MSPKEISLTPLVSRINTYKTPIKFLVLILVLVIYFIYSYFILSPQSYKYFSLINDGEGIVNTHRVKECLTIKKCDEILPNLVFERHFKRFRPAFWMSRVTMQSIAGLDVQLQYEMRVYIIGTIVAVLLFFCIINAGGGVLGAVIGVTIFITNSVFTSMIMDIGSIEPFQVLWLAIFSLFYLNIDKLEKNIRKLWIGVILFFLSLILFFTKETSIVLLPVLVLISFFFSRKDKGYVIPVIFSVVIFVIGLLISSVGVKNAIVAGSYNFNPYYVLKNTVNWITLLSDTLFPLFRLYVLLLACVLVNAKLSKLIFDKKYIYWTCLMISFTAILFAWPFVMPRYFFVTIFCFSIVSSVALIKIARYLEDKVLSFTKNLLLTYFLFWIFFLFITSNILFSSISMNLAISMNFKTSKVLFLEFQHDSLEALSGLDADKFYVNAIDSLDNWEVLFEMPIHLTYLYNQSPKIIKASSANLPKSSYFFTRSGMILAVNKDQLKKTNTRTISYREYEAYQIDPSVFKNDFSRRPIQTLVKPPLYKDPLLYYFEIIQIK